MDADRSRVPKRRRKKEKAYYEAKCLVEIWADEEIQRQLSAMGRKQNIWENIAAKLNDNGYKRYKLLSLSKTEYLVPKKAQMQSPR